MTLRDVLSTIPDENLVGIVIGTEEGNCVLAFAPLALSLKLDLTRLFFKDKF